ncbi:MAG TPA: LamG domain-containing protein [Microbacterium sp.]|uniref:LamG domain-containing protein n=1 Tax=Microbacterium sp. TaxID=51671 RepID=UPI002CD3CF5B|nr:LamG domain-containing protein [Microbacterium sp.]HWI30005.1 LamG domain-containing protein [Microbacterium sp.]
MGAPSTRRNRPVATLVTAVMLVLLGAGAWAYWLATTAPGGNGASAATSVNAGATPGVSVAGASVTVTWTASTLATGHAVTGYQIRRYDAGTLAPQTVLSGCTGIVTATSCVETSVPPGSWKYTVTPRFATNWAGAESGLSGTALIETTPPTNALTLSGVTGNAAKSGDTVYYRGTAAGSFTLTNAVADAGSGPASSQTAALTGTTTGWTHTPSTVSTPAGGPYVSNPFSWSAGATSSPSEVVTGRDAVGNLATTTLTFVNDSTAPTAGSISYLDGYQAGRSVAVTFASGTDSGSGIATRQLQRSAAQLTNGTCGTFSAFVNIGSNNPTSVYTDSQVSNAVCYMYRYVVTDLVGNQHIATSASVSKVDYAGAVSATAGALSHWRFGEGSATLTSSDSFTGAAGALTSHTGEIGATWTHLAGGSNARLSDANRVRRGGPAGTTIGYTIDYATATPPSADYSVEADLNVRSVLGGDVVGVAGRINTATNTFYLARWEQATASWNLIKYTNGTVSSLGSVTGQPALVVGETYRIRLEMVGSALKLYVNGVLTTQGTDATITAPGRAGIMDGANASSAAKSNTTGIHLDNFQVTPSTYPRALDSKGSNPGDYKNGVVLGVSGALPADPNAAAQFDGVNDHVQMTGTTGIPVGASVRSTELWFKTSSAARQVLFAYGSGGNTQQYGLWIDAGGASMTAWGFGNGNDKQFTMPAAVNNGAWHQVVLTYNGTTLTLYIDGVALTPQAATRGTVMSMYGFSVGAILNSTDGNYGGWYTGSLDEVSFYTSALTQTDVTNHYQLGSSAAGDVSGPSGGSVDAAGLTGTGARYSTSTALSIAFSPGTDPSGIAAAGATLSRATATLTSAGGTANGVCGTFGGYSLVSGGTDPVSPKSDTVADQACYRYRYTVADTLGNPTSYTSGDVKVDSTAPSAPPLAFSAFTNTYWSSGSTVYYRGSAASGSFTVTGTATDSASGIASYTYPALGTSWTSTPGALGVNTYSWSGAPAAPGTIGVTATSNAGTASASSPLTLTADNTAPTAGTVSYVDGSTGGTTVSVGFTTGTDAGSGVGTRLLQRSSAPLVGLTCGTYGAFATVSGGTNPTSPVVDTVPAGTCNRYQYVVTDNVGNAHTASSSNVAHTPYGAYWAFNAGAGTSAVDSFGNNNTGTLQAGAGWTTGKVGAAALNLNGTASSWVDVANPVIDSSESYTVAAWVKPTTLTGTQTFASIDGTNISPFYLQLTGGVFTFSQRGADSTSSVLAQVNGSAPVVGTWYHVVGVYNKQANTISLYVNGVAQGSATATTAWKAGGHTVIGRAKWGGAAVDQVNGAIDEVRFYDRVLTPGELSDLAGTYSEILAATPGLLSHWRLGEASSALPMDDITATNNNGTYVGAPTMGVGGAIAGDSSTAVQFDGVDDYATATRQISGNFSVELWFKSTQNFSNDFGQPHCSNWWQGAGLVDAESSGTLNDFGVSLCSGKVVAGTGNPDTSAISPATYNDGGWHHVVFTRVQATGALTLYVDGAAVGTATGNTAALTASAVINIGRSASAVHYFNGTIDEVAVYSSVLSPATVAAHYNAGL